MNHYVFPLNLKTLYRLTNIRESDKEGKRNQALPSHSSGFQPEELYGFTTTPAKPRIGLPYGSPMRSSSVFAQSRKRSTVSGVV